MEKGLENQGAMMETNKSALLASIGITLLQYYHSTYLGTYLHPVTTDHH